MDTYEHLKEPEQRYVRAVITPKQSGTITIEYLKTPNDKLSERNRFQFWQGRVLMILFSALIIIILSILTVGALYGLFF